MNRIFNAPVRTLLTFVFIGLCGGTIWLFNPNTNKYSQPEKSNVSSLGNVGSLDHPAYMFIVEADGCKYIVLVGSSGVAVCPATKP